MSRALRRLVLGLGSGWCGVASAGDVTGTITGPTGSPVEGATVVVYDQRLNYAVEETDADGRFTIADIPGNPYRVRVLPAPEDNLVERYLPDQLLVCSGDVFVVPGAGQRDVGTWALAEGGLLTGRLIDPRGEPVVGAEVAAITAEGEPPLAVRYATTDDDGAYAVPGLPPGIQLVVQVDPIGMPRQWVPGVYLEELAQRFIVPGVLAASIGDVLLLDGIAVSGTVTGPAGPVTGAQVQVYTPSEILSAVTVDGAWDVDGLPPGDVLAWAAAPGLAQTYYPSDDRPGERVPASEGEVVEGLAITMIDEAVLRGRFLAPGDPGNAGEVRVVLYNDDHTVAFSGEVEPNGAFQVLGLRGGAYTMTVFGAEAGATDDAIRDPSGAERVFELGDGEDLDVGDLTLVEGATIRGTVVDRYTGEPVYGAYVYAQPLEGDAGAVSATAHDGTYALVGLPADTWSLWVEYAAWCPDDVDWASRYYPDQVNPDLGGVVQLTTGEEVVWDPEVAPDADHDAMDDVWEGDQGLDPARDDAAEDADADGFSNLEEYLLGTDPTGDEAAGRGCGCDHGRAAIVVPWMLPFYLARRRRGSVSGLAVS